MKKKLVTVLLASSMVATMIVVDIMSEINYITWI